MWWMNESTLSLHKILKVKISDCTNVGLFHHIYHFPKEICINIWIKTFRSNLCVEFWCFYFPKNVSWGRWRKGRVVFGYLTLKQNSSADSKLPSAVVCFDTELWCICTVCTWCPLVHDGLIKPAFSFVFRLICASASKIVQQSSKFI